MGCSGPSGSANPSMVSTLAPSTCQAKTVQDFIALPSTCTTQAPHCEVSQPTWVPVRRSSSRRNCTNSVRGSMSPVTALPFTVIATGAMMNLLDFSRISRISWPFGPFPRRGGADGSKSKRFCPLSGLGTRGPHRGSPCLRRHSRGKLLEKIVGSLLGGAVDQPLAELRQLAADLRLHVIGEARA